MGQKNNKFFFVDHESLDKGHLEVHLYCGTENHDGQVEQHIWDYDVEKDQTVTVYELVPVATYVVTSNFKKLV